MIQPRLHMCPAILNPSTTSLPSPSLRDCPRAPALSALIHALNLHWSSFSHIVIYMFQCYSLISSHPCLLPHSPKVCSLHLCLFCCLAYRVVFTIILNTIYMHYYTELVFLFLTYFTQYDRFTLYIVLRSNIFGILPPLLWLILT